jgi:hypothetical protein
VPTVPDLFSQTRPAAGYPADATAFADALELIMADGTHDLDGIAAALNARKIVGAGNAHWTPATLGAYLASLANA